VKLSESRLGIAVLLLPVLYFLITLLPPFPFFLLVTIAVLTAQYEFYKLYYRNENPKAIFLGLILGGLVLSRFYFTLPVSSDTVISTILMIVLIFQLFFFRTIQQSLLDSAILFMGIFYLAGFLGYLIAIRQIETGFIFFLLFVVWGGDAGAYYIGRSIGGTKLYPIVSPNKTVSGAIGGLLTSLAGGCIAKLLFISSSFPLTWKEAVFLSLLLGGVGQLGDLVESLFKRSTGVKDSGVLVPAHGGILDKLDGVAFAAPVLYHCLIFAQG